jgi:ribosomal protein S1
MKTFSSLIKKDPNIPNTNVEGTVYNIEKNIVYVDLETKDSVKLNGADPSLFQVRYLQVGDQTRLCVREDNIHIAGSLTKENAWDLICKVYRTKSTILGRLLSKIKGGGGIGLLGFIGFIPNRFLYKKRRKRKYMSPAFLRWLKRQRIPQVGDLFFLKIHEMNIKRRRFVLRRLRFKNK